MFAFHLGFSCLLEGFPKIKYKNRNRTSFIFSKWSVEYIITRFQKNLCVRLGFQRETDGQHNNNVFGTFWKVAGKFEFEFGTRKFEFFYIFKVEYIITRFKKIFVSDWGFNVKLTGNTTATLLLKSSREIWRARVFPNVPCVFTRYFVR